MLTIPFTFDALAGLAIGLVFTLVCLRDMSRAVLWYVALAWVPFFQVATFSGGQATEGFMQVEWLATIMIVVWLLKRPPFRPHGIIRTSFNAPLLLLIPLSIVSLVIGFAGVDPAIDASHVKLSVSIGQILLAVWPIGIYFVVANSINRPESVRKVVRLVILLALPAIALPLATTRIRPYLEWSLYFALAASPYCFAASLQARPFLRKVGWIALALVPIVYGAQTGKALWYVAPLAGGCVVAALRARRQLVALLPVALGLYLLVYVPLSGSPLPGPLRRLVAVEERQQSLGGRAGRVALALDTIRIWRRYPVFGVGPGNNYPYMDHYSVIATPHDQYLTILLEMGIVGLASYLAFLVGAFKTGLDLLRSVRDRFHETYVLGWLGLFAGMAVGGLLGDFSLPSIRNGGIVTLSLYYLQWVMLGLMVAVKRIEEAR